MVNSSVSDNWERTQLGMVLEKIKGGSNAEQHDNEGKYPVSRIETIANGSIDPTAVKYSNLNVKEYEKHAMKKGDILFSNINSPDHIGKTAMYRGKPKNLIHGMNLILLRPDSSKVHPEFLFRYLKYLKAIKTFKDMCKQAVNQASLAQKDIKPIDIPIPPIKEQEKIVEKLDRILERIEEIKIAQKRKEDIENNILQPIINSVMLERTEKEN